MLASLCSDRLCQLDFPIFNVKFISNDFFVISGGGGSSKTGVPNKIIFFKINKKDGHAVCENVCEINTQAYLANCVEYVREKSLLFVGFNDSFQIFRISITDDHDTGVNIETSSIGIFDVCDVGSSENYSDGLRSTGNGVGDTTTRSIGEVSSCSIRELTNKTDSYISDMIILPDKQHIAGTVKIIIALNYGLVVFSEITDDDNFEIQHYKSYKPIKRFKIAPTYKNIIHLTPDGIIYVWSYPDFQLVSNIDLNVHSNGVDDRIRISCKCFTFITDEKTRKSLLVGAFSTSGQMSNKKPSNSSYMCKFGLDNFLPVCDGISTGIDRIVSMDTSEIGSSSYIACGTLSGSLMMIDGHSSKIIGQSKNIHSIGVTSLSFVKDSCDSSNGLSMSQDNAINTPLGVISCSADSSCAYTQLRMQKPTKSYLPYICIALCFLALFTSIIIGTNSHTSLLA